MNCREFEEKLNDLLDRRSDTRKDLQLLGHAKICRDCAQSWEIYAGFDELGSDQRPQTKKGWPIRGYVAIGIAASILLFLLSPLGTVWLGEPDVPGQMVQLDTVELNLRAAELESRGEEARQTGSEVNRFWQDRPFIKEFALPQPPEFEKMGASINSVWETIREDPFLVPIIKHGALYIVSNH
ncbi:MAG: hypothetical protein VX768_00675 [Planctomycetota bacterium]|nr:hypothetical protein [Planctomycetota bacterium]